MKNKFNFLTKESLKSKINTKAFKGINIFLCILLIIVFNIDSIIKLFGGDFDDLVNIYVVDEVGMYDDFEKTMNNSALDLLQSYNAKVSKSDKDLNTLKDEIIKDKTGDIILYITPSEKVSAESIFNAEIISFDYVDNLLYQEITSSLNTTKRNMALEMSNISDELLNSIDKSIDIKRTLLDESLNENDELIKLIGSIMILVFILPIFMLIISVVQMIGAEINEEKSSKGMEIIISSVSPQTHFLSKLVSSNLFALLQAMLIGIYGLIGFGIRLATTGPIDIAGTISTFSSQESSVSVSSGEIATMLSESNFIPKLLSGIPFFIILIILTVAAYTIFIGILASVTTSMEDFNQIQTPVMMFLMASYFLAIFASVYQGASFLKIMSYVPFISGILAPVMYCLGETGIISLIVSILLLCMIIFLLYKYGLKIYKVGILNYSSNNLWKKIFKALKN